MRLRIVIAALLVACGSTHADATDGGVEGGVPAGSACRANADCATSSCTGGLCACPDGMSTVPHASGPATCIDRVEVTNRAYADFVSACPDGCPSLLPFRCSGDTKITPRTADTTDPGVESSINCFREASPARIGAGYEDYPVVCIDWCSAFAYCAWRGKRLCNGSEWVDACSDRGAKKFAYAQTFDACACNVADDNGDAVTCADGMRGADMTRADQPPSCASASGALDLDGNAAEWTAECDEDPVTSATDKCTYRGGSWTSAPNDTTCSSSARLERVQASSVVGFRCCSG